jgi:hypothetical protein
VFTVCSGLSGRRAKSRFDQQKETTTTNIKLEGNFDCIYDLDSSFVAITVAVTIINTGKL